MATKVNFSFLNNKQQSFANSHTSDNDNQYSNLNLNQSYKCSNVSTIHSQSKSNNDKNREKYKSKDGTATTSKLPESDYPEGNEKPTSWNNLSKNGLSSKNSTSLTFTNETGNTAKKDLKESSLNSDINKSTLSLHISAYENSVEAAPSDSFGDKRLTKKQDNAFMFQNPFEFSKQQNYEVLEPEMCHYKASQRIFNFNEAPKKSLNLLCGFDKAEVKNNVVGKNAITNAFEIPRGQEGNNNNTEPEVMQFKPSQKLLDSSEANKKNKAGNVAVNDKAGAKTAKSGGGRSDTDLQHLRARFHATQFRFTSALAAEHGKASDGVFRIQLKPSDNLKPTMPPPKDIYEPIEPFENEEGLKGVEAKEPEYDMFAGDSSSDESGLLEEWDPAFIAEIQRKCNIRWRESVMEEDPLTDKDELQAIRKRRAEEVKEKENKKKEELKRPLKPVETFSKESLGGPAGGAPIAPSLSKESLDAPPHAPAFSPGALPSAEPLIPVTNLLDPLPGSQEALGVTLSRESILPTSTESESKLNATSAATSTTTTKGGEPLFDCLENEIILDDSNLTEITNGLKEGRTYDNALVSEDLKKKLLEIHENKEKVEEELVRKALEREDTPVKTDATANKIVEALTDYDVIAKMVAVEDSKMLKEYFDGSRKADDEVIAALDRVIDRILDRASDVYPNKEELALFLRNRGTAKSHLLDAMLSRKGGWLQNMYGSAYNTALAIYSGANKTVEVVGKGLAAAKDVAEQSTTMARDYAATTVDVVNRSYTKANELAEQSATVAREVATKGSEMYSKAADVASYSTEQARRVASVTALFAGKVSSVVSSASSLASSSSTTSVSSSTSGGSSATSDTQSTIPSTASISVTSTSDGSIVSHMSTSDGSNVSASNTLPKGSIFSADKSSSATTGSGDETKSTDAEEKTTPVSTPLADSPVPLTFNGFMDCPSPPHSPSKPVTTPAATGNTESILTTVWKSLTEVFMASYGGNLGESRESSKEEEPPKEDKTKKD